MYKKLFLALMLVLVPVMAQAFGRTIIVREPVPYQWGAPPTTQCAPQQTQRIYKTKPPAVRTQPLYTGSACPSYVPPPPTAVAIPAMLPDVEVVVRRRMVRPVIRATDLYAPRWAAGVPILDVGFPARRFPLLSVFGLGVWIGGW
jgi:hypothetical protein